MRANVLARWFRQARGRMMPTAEAYALWAESYPPRPHNPLMAVEQSVVAPILGACAARVALDVGTGTGRNLPLLRAAGACVSVGVDLSPAMLARHQAGARRVCADACALPFRDGCFDLVCSSLMAGDLVDLGGWIREAARVLVPGGHLVYSDFHPEWSERHWRRTFTAPDGELIEIPYVPHPLDEHLGHCRERRLLVRAIREPRVAGKAAPVVIVFHLEKPRSDIAASLDGVR